MANRSLTVVGALGCALGLLTLLPTPAAAQCQLCAPTELTAQSKKNPAPITIQIETRIDFGSIGLVRANQGGTAVLNATSGQRLLTGSLVNLGGFPVTGTVIIRGEPNEHVTVDFPATVQILNSGGASYPLSNFTTTLKNNPKIDHDGTLRFTFGATLQISGAATGTFHGSIPVTVDYR
jgi:hypothetical protein